MHKSDQSPRHINWFFVSAKVTLIMTAMLVQASWTTTGCGGGANNPPLDANQQARIADLENQLAQARNTASASPSPATTPTTTTPSPSPSVAPPDLVGPPVVPTIDPTETVDTDIPNVTIVDGGNDWESRWRFQKRRNRRPGERRVMLPDPQTRGGDSYTFVKNVTNNVVNVNIVIINNNGTTVEDYTQTLSNQDVDVKQVGEILTTYAEAGKPITQQDLQEVVDECIIIEGTTPVDPPAPSPSPATGSQ